MPADAQAFDSQELRKVLGAFATGVTVITTVDEEGRFFGLTANSFSSVSLEPPLILWSQSRAAPSYAAFSKAEKFGVSILSEDQVEISNRFAKSGQEKFAGVPIKLGRSGVPLVEGAAAQLECVREASYAGGDHTVFLGRVAHIDHSERSPLLFSRGKYMVAAHHELRRSGADVGVSSLSHLHGVRVASGIARELATSLGHTLGVAVWGNKGPTLVRWEESPTPVSINLCTGMVMPVFGSASGLALAAFLPEDMTAEVIRHEIADQRDEFRPKGWEAAQAMLAEVRRAGHAELTAGDAFTALYGAQVNAVSVPALDRNGVAVLALTVLGHARETSQAWRDRMASALKPAAAAISAKLGASAPLG